MNYRVGYIDEDPDAVNKCRRKLGEHEIEVISYNLDDGIELKSLIDEIEQSGVDLLLIDYKLENQVFNGDRVEKHLDEASPLFPWLVFTNNKEDAENYIKDWEKIVDKRVFTDDDQLMRFAEVIKHKIDNSKERKRERKETLADLLSKGESDGLTPSEIVKLEKIKNYLQNSDLNPDSIGNQEILRKENVDNLKAVRKDAQEFIEQLLQQNNVSGQGSDAS